MGPSCRTASQPPADFMRRFADGVFQVIETALVAALAIMVCLVFGNVVLRYGFRSGVTISDEVARLLFLWVTFAGSVCVLRLDGHLGLSGVLHRLDDRARFACLLLSRCLMLACCVLLTWGAVRQTQLNIANAMPVSGLPTALAYGAAVVSGFGMGLLILVDLVAMIVTGRDRTDAAPEPGP
jgi:TRAP-type transport system small permease protein